MRTFILLFITLVWHAGLQAQQYMTRDGIVEFFSSTPIEDIEAVNNQTTALLTAEGKFAFRVPILGFRFERALMEEHFNENYLESTTYPNGTFEGHIPGFDETQRDGNWHEVVAYGTLVIHGIAVEREIPSKLKWNGEAWEIESSFTVPPAAHAIEIPKIVAKKIAEEIEVKVRATLSPRS